MAANDPPPVATMLGRYRSMLAAQGYDWGNEIEGGISLLLQLADRCDVQRWNAVFAEWKAAGRLADPVDALLRALADPLPAGIAVVRGDSVEIGQPLPYALAGHPYSYFVITQPAANAPGTVRQSAVSGEHPHLHIGSRRVLAAEVRPTGRIRLLADDAARWSVVDDRGGAWFPESAPVKYDAARRPYFHGNDLVVEVPAGEIAVTVARGCEFRPTAAPVRVTAGGEALVKLSPTRLYETDAIGWYGGDLHVHLNYTGDLVWSPEDALRVQRGEGLHLMNLVAANYSTALVYDREALEYYGNQDIPAAGAGNVARFGIEYRNDLFGHFHVLGPSAPPTRYSTGHPRSGEPYDWPPNATAAAEFRRLGATIGYTHPAAVPLDGAGPPAEVFAEGRARSYEARELVADAALGLVDSVDLMVGDIAGAQYLYHRLLGCGLRLAATAGTDVMLSRSRGRLTSNPPGWCRAYAYLGREPLSVAAWQGAVRAGRTFATNGPWLELQVGGCAPGDTHACASPGRVTAVARTAGLGVSRLEIVGPEGVIAAALVAPGAERSEFTAEIEITGPTWLAAITRGGHHPMGVGDRPQVYAHTSPVWVNVAGRRAARKADALWCLDWLDRFEVLARRQGRFASAKQLHDLLDVLDRARDFYRGIAGLPDREGGGRVTRGSP